MYQYLLLHFLLWSTVAALRDGKVFQRAEGRMVPSVVNNALREVLRQSQNAAQQAQQVKAKATAFREVARQRELEAKNKTQETEEMLEQLTSQKQMLVAKQRQVNLLMSTKNESQEAWRVESMELANMQANLTREEGEYAELQKRVQKEIARLTDQQLAADKRLRELQAAYEKKQEKVDRLREEAVSRGGIARNASQEADVVQANLAEAEGLVTKHRRLAEASEKVFLQAKMDLDHAERLCLDSEHEVAEKHELKLRVLAARDSLQAFYNSMDNLTLLLEAKVMDPETHAHELLRAEPQTAAALRAYNDMTASFRRLFVKSKETYEVVAGSIPEIESNAEAAFKLLCDPFEAIEEEALRTANGTYFDEKCGSGLWRYLKVERSAFPNLDETTGARQEATDPAAIQASASQEVTAIDQRGGAESTPQSALRSLPPLPVPTAEPEEPEMGLPPPPLERLPSKTTPLPDDMDLPG